ncbi:MAG TPA: DUF2062 domain-containing protein [Noviherbaspirillum sp.]|jgi:uncharacterized protein (DUF2062 family)|uniref:DUF2062 domain-containing protein n=1 Tax=Noviherbaspirillum sp. TaxID=1926288 RepID=UPI002F93D3A8
MKKSKKGSFLSRLPAAEQIRQSSLLRVFGPWLDRHWLWQFNRRTVAGGAAIGLFFGILIPFFQIFFAVVGAIALRANVPVAVACTFVTNPFTFPPIYYLAWRLGEMLIGRGGNAAAVGTQPEVTAAAEAAAAASDVAVAAAEEAGRLAAAVSEAMQALQSMGLPLAIGLMVLSVTVSATAYILIRAAWSSFSRYRWMTRRAGRASGTGPG